MIYRDAMQLYIYQKQTWWIDSNPGDHGKKQWNNLQEGPSFHFHDSSKQRALVDLHIDWSCCSNDGKGSQKICNRHLSMILDSH